MVLGLLALFVVGFVFFRGPIPHISIAPEPLTKVGGVKITNTMITSWIIVVLISSRHPLHHQPQVDDRARRRSELR